jgi:hypothetical protein
MQTLLTLLDLACGRPFRPEDEGRARRGQLMISALLASLVAAALWGLAAGGRELGPALANLYKVPMVVLLSVLSAAPAGLLAWKLSGVAMRPSDLMLAFVTGVLAGTLVMAVLAPLLALYYNTSAWAGPLLAMGSTFAALAVAVVTFVRGAMRRRPPGVSRAGLLVPIVVVITMQLGTLLQFIAVAQSILPETTPFDGGIDRIVPR